MDFGFRQRLRAKPPRRPAGRPVGRAPSANSDKPKKREGEPPSRWSLVGDAVHGIVFLGLAAASVLYFGQSFDVIAAVVAALAILSLKEAWTGLRGLPGKEPLGK